MHRYRNGLKTAVLLASLSALIMVAGALIGGPKGLVIAFVIALGTNGYAYFNSAQARAALDAGLPGDSSTEQPVMYRVVQRADVGGRAADAARCTCRRPTRRTRSRPAATPSNAAVCCTEGILALLDERELRGVLGHELAHVYNRDILISSVAAALASGDHVPRPVRVLPAVPRRRRATTGTANPLAACCWSRSSARSRPG